jgi:hypothetical protein
MSRPRFLIDEDTDPVLASALRQAQPTIDIVRVGDPGAPPRGTLDPDLLVAAEVLGRVLISHDRTTMPTALMNHFAAGRHTAGVILLRRGFPLAREVQKIEHQWSTTEADDWIDRTIYLP